MKLPCAGGVRVTPAGRSDTAYRLISSAQFFARALAEILFKTHDALNDFLLQRSRAGRALSRLELFFF